MCVKLQRVLIPLRIRSVRTVKLETKRSGLTSVLIPLRIRSVRTAWNGDKEDANHDPVLIPLRIRSVRTIIS